MAEEDSLGWTSPIHEAVWKNDVSTVQKLIEEKPQDLEAVIEECTPLYLACLKGHKDVAEVLIKGGAKVDGDSPPLFAAAGKGNLELVEVLYKNGAAADAFSTQHAGCCALHIAAEKNYVPVVKALLSYGVDVNIRSKKQQLTPLISAACCGSLDAVEVLAAEGADVNAQSSTGNTALMLAIDRGKIDVALYLIKCGADLEVRGQKGWTALHNAASGGERGYKEVANALLEAGASVDALSETMLTPLHEAAGKSLVDLVSLLVKWGANVNSRDKFNNTALRMCASNAQAFATIDSFKQTVKILLEAGADINAGTTINTTSLHSVVKWGDVEAVKFMLDNGADANIATKKGELPIDFAKDAEMIHLLEEVTQAREKSPEPSAPEDSSSSPTATTAATKSGVPQAMDVEKLRAKYSNENWMPDSETKNCLQCGVKFTVIVRKHHCRNCGLIFCDKCTSKRMKLPHRPAKSSAVRVCGYCADVISAK